MGSSPSGPEIGRLDAALSVVEAESEQYAGITMSLRRSISKGPTSNGARYIGGSLSAATQTYMAAAEEHPPDSALQPWPTSGTRPRRRKVSVVGSYPRVDVIPVSPD